MHDWIMWLNSGPIFDGYGYDGDIGEITRDVDEVLDDLDKHDPDPMFVSGTDWDER